MIKRFLVWWLRRAGGEVRVSVPVAGAISETVYVVAMTPVQYRAWQETRRQAGMGLMPERVQGHG